MTVRPPPTSSGVLLKFWLRPVEGMQGDALRPGACGCHSFVAVCGESCWRRTSP